MLRVVALLLTILTGFSGLVYEVTWQKYLAILLGSHSEATATVLGIFLGSLAAGYWVFGAVTRRATRAAVRAGASGPRLLLLYGAVEAGIGLYALLFPWMFQAARAVSLHLPNGSPVLAFAGDVGLTAFLIAPPVVLMGGTIPILTQALARGLEDATRFHAFVYAFNTAGAFTGALAAGFVLISWLGLEGTLRAMGCVNLGAGALFLALGAFAPTPVAESEIGAEPSDRLAAFAAVALLVGFAMMAVQTVLIRIGGLALGASQFTFSIVVAVFVLCIALGSFAVSALPRIPRWLLPYATWALAACLTLLYVGLGSATYWVHRLRVQFGTDASDFHPFFLAVAGLVLAVLLLPVGLSGATLPLVFHHLRDRVDDLGGIAGRLYGWNTVGSLLGALLGGYALLFWIDLHAVYRIAVVAVVAAAGVLTVHVLEVKPLRVAGLLVLPAVVAVLLLPEWEPRRLSAGLFRKRTPIEGTLAGPDALFGSYLSRLDVAFHADDPTATVVVFEHEEKQTFYHDPLPDSNLSRSLWVNGKPDGSIPGDYPTMALAAIVPSLLADHCERALVIGLGTGVSAGELGALPCTEQVRVAEISRGVIEAAPLFDYGNLGASRNPKVRLERTDAYRALLRGDERYDVIVSEPSNPWVVGVEMLFSREFLEAARARLAPGGVYCQWFHTYEADRDLVELVLRTYDAVFADVAVWFTMHGDVILLGFEDATGARDLARMEARARQPAFAAAIERSGAQSFAALLAHEILPVGALRAAHLEGEIHTLLHPILSDHAARAFFRADTTHLRALPTAETLAAARKSSLLGAYLRRFQDGIPDEVRVHVAAELCQYRVSECVTWLAHWAREAPDSPLLAYTLERVRAIPRFAPQRVLSAVGALFDDRPATGRIPGGRTRALEVFEYYFFPALPFEPEALRGMWATCAPDDERCRAGRERAIEMVGAVTHAERVP